VVHALLAAYDIKRTFQFVGCGAFAVVIFFTLFLSRPESLHQSSPAAAPKTVARNLQGHDLAWRDMIKTTTFYKYWIMFTFAASGGVMIFGNLANIAIKQAQWENGYLLVILMASFNTLGRLSSGAISDRIGVKNTLRIVFILQMVNMILFNNYRTSAVLVVGTAFLGFCYGGLIAMFPASIAGEFGIRNLGTNYALLNTAYGVAAFVGPMMAGKIVDATGSYHLAFIGSAVLLLLATIISFTLKARHQK